MIATARLAARSLELAKATSILGYWVAHLRERSQSLVTSSSFSNAICLFLGDCNLGAPLTLTRDESATTCLTLLIALPVHEQDRHECRKYHGGDGVWPLDERQPCIYPGLKGSSSPDQVAVAYNDDKEHTGSERDGDCHLQQSLEQSRHRQFLGAHNQHRRFHALFLHRVLAGL
jgi:hypothetical protein